MATSASLVVKISADINDFTRQLDTMTRGVDRAAKKIESVGKAITLGITVPVIAAAAALAKMAAENEDTGARLERVFGSAADSVNASIKKMMSSVPEGNTELQKMAISVDNMAQGLGLAPAKAAKMSESLLKLAGDASAFAHVPMEQALDAISRGLAGKTKGLLEFGIAINETDIKQKALAMGLLHEGNQLTETGTALASYALIMERSSRITGEAERTAGQAGKQFSFLKRDLGELADNVSHLVLPALSDLAKKAREVVDWFSKLDESTVKTFFQFAAAAAVIGPVLFGLVRLVDLVFKLKAAFTLLSAGGTLVGFFGSIAALPFATILAGVVAITGALGALYLAWKKFGPSSGSPSSVASAPQTIQQRVAAYQQGLQSAAGKTPAAALLGGKDGPTEFAPDPMKTLDERAHAVTESLKQMSEGWQIPNLTKVWFDTLGMVERKLSTIKDLMSPDAAKLRGMIEDLKNAAATAFGAPTLPNVGIPGLQRGAQSGVTINPQVATLPDLSAATIAATRYAETQNFVSQQIAYDYQRVRDTLGQFGLSLGNVSERMQNVIVTLYNAATNFAMQLASTAGGSGKGAGLGRGIGGLLGGVIGSVIPGLGTAVGAAVGGVVGTAAGGLLGGMFDHASTSTNRAADSMNTLAKTVERVNASITNVPAWFKVQSYRFEAAPVIAGSPMAPTPYNPGGSPSTPSPTNPNAPTPFAPGENRIPAFNFYGDIHVHEVTDADSLLKKIQAATLRQVGTGTAGRLAFSGGLG